MADSDRTARQPRRANGAETAAMAAFGAICGGILDQDLWGAVSGGALGALFGLWQSTERRRKAMDRELDWLTNRVDELEGRGVAPADEASAPAPTVTAPPPAEAQTPTAPPDTAGRPAKPPLSGPLVPPPRPPLSEPLAPRPASPPVPPARPTPAIPAGPGPFDRAATAARDFFFGGNTVVRVGILVLLVGVLLLAKWAADNALFPIEARLALSALIGLALVAVGFRLREARPGFSQSLQGGGIAALYLVVFIAMRVFSLLPPSLAFLLLVAIAVGGGALAVLQSSQPLIFIGSLGGFLAPVLASTGQGNHVVLFSYYLLLNLAIAAVSWFRSWRPLNILAFVCTYGVAVGWGVLRYRPEHFASTEPFLLAYLVLFTGIAVVFAWRRPPKLAGIIDGTLVFGTALVTLLAQARLVEGREFGMAYSAAGLGLFYAALATFLWRAAPDTLRRLSEAFIALAVGFGTLAIPFALDDALSTSLAWALEGAGIYWVGTRQDRRLARFAGIALQALAAVAFANGTAGPGVDVPAERALANARFLGCVGIAFAGSFIAREAWRFRERLAGNESLGTQLLALWGLAWWVGGGLAEIDQFVATRFEISAILAGIAATALTQEWLGARLGWLPGRLLALWSIPAGFLGLFAALQTQTHLLANGAYLVWPALLATIYTIVHRLEKTGVAEAPRAYVPAFLLAALAASSALYGVADEWLALDGDWPIAAFGLGLAGVLAGGRVAVEREVGPFGRLPELHLRTALAPVAGLALLWIALLNVSGRGDAAPLPYLPLLNVLDLSVALLFVATAGWWQRLIARHEDVLRHPGARSALPLAGVLAFLWLNGILARSVHQWTGVRFDVDPLWNSVSLQVAFSIAWTLVALAGMWASTRRRLRPAWIAFASLLGVTVVKLFVVDLSQLSTGAKIGTFLVVGVLLLVVGYLSPVPPSRGGEADEPLEAGSPAPGGQRP